MASAVGICNSALTKLGATRITALDEGSKNANACNDQYERGRDDLLRAHVWNFATARAKLPRLSAVPEFEFQYAFQLPSDGLRTVSVHDNESGAGLVRYRIEGRTLLSDAADIYLKFIRVVPDPNDMPADFREALAFLLARDLAVAIAQSNSLRDRMSEQADISIRRAKSTDAIEDFPESLPEGGWVAAR